MPPPSFEGSIPITFAVAYSFGPVTTPSVSGPFSVLGNRHYATLALAQVSGTISYVRWKVWPPLLSPPTISNRYRELRRHGPRERMSAGLLRQMHLERAEP